MLPIKHLMYHYQTRSFKFLLYIASLMIFFWAIYDGILAFLVPVLITNHGFSKTQMGLIIASSSVSGAIFDFVISKILVNTHYRRLFLLVYGFCIGFVSLLWLSDTAALFVVSMAIWGIYYDLQNFANFDFVSRNSPGDDHCYSFGIIGIFRSLGYLLAPIIAGFLIAENTNSQPFLFAAFFLGISFLFYLLLTRFAVTHSPHPEPKHKKSNFFMELRLWRKIGAILFPVLVFNTILFVFDATFWTIGPLFSESYKNFKDFGGLFMTMYSLPTLFTGWFVEPLADRFGKKRTAYVAFFLANLMLIPMFWVQNPIFILMTIFSASTIGSIAWPAIKGAYVDYITESHSYEKEIEGLNDFSTNLGFVIGPIMAGVFSDKFGNGASFSILGLVNIIIIAVLFIVTPKNIHVVVHRDKQYPIITGKL